MKKYLITIISVIAVLVLCSCAKKVNWSSLKPDDAILTVNDKTYTFDQLTFKYTDEKAAYDAVSEYYADGTVGFDDYELSMDQIFRDFESQAALSALADAEGIGLSQDDAVASAKDTYVDSADIMPAFGAYLEKIKEEMGIDDDKLVEYGALSVKLYYDASAVAAREYKTLLESNPNDSDEELAKKLAKQLAKVTKGISVKNNVTNLKEKPDYSDFALEYVQTHVK